MRARALPLSRLSALGHSSGPASVRSTSRGGAATATGRRALPLTTRWTATPCGLAGPLVSVGPSRSGGGLAGTVATSLGHSFPRWAIACWRGTFGAESLPALPQGAFHTWAAKPGCALSKFLRQLFDFLFFPLGAGFAQFLEQLSYLCHVFPRPWRLASTSASLWSTSVIPFFLCVVVLVFLLLFVVGGMIFLFFVGVTSSLRPRVLFKFLFVGGEVFKCRQDCNASHRIGDRGRKRFVRAASDQRHSG